MQDSPSDWSAQSLAIDAMACLDELARCTEVAGQLTRRYLTSEHRQASELVERWMADAGMSVRRDAVGNVVGRYESAAGGGPALMLGSHLDTVRDAGRFDGALGVVLPVLCVRQLQDAGRRLDFPIEVLAFGDEEGTRFQSTYLGSRAVAGTFDHSLLGVADEDGVTMREAMAEYGLDPDRIDAAARPATDLAGFVEVHIEQGPVLESEELPVAVVTAIAGATRLAVSLHGEAGHAGTVPMTLRRDALTAAAEAVLLIEKRCQGPDLVGTVGRIEAYPGAINVIPGTVRFTVDVRSGNDVHRTRAVQAIVDGVREIARCRRLEVDVETTHSARSTACDPGLSEQLAGAVAAAGYPVRRLPSGAGHDAAAMASVTPAAMLFVRCWRGISHHPDESMSTDDIAAAARVLQLFLNRFGHDT